MIKSSLMILFIASFVACHALKSDTAIKANVKDSSSSTSTQMTNQAIPQHPVQMNMGPDTVKTNSGLQYIIYRHKGGSERPNYADKVSVHYRGYLADGSLFSESYKNGEPFVFQLGMHKVIKGWDEGIAHLSVGDSALLIIPPALGYGEKERGGVPANSTLYYYIEVINIKEPVFVTEYIWQNKQAHITASGLKYYIVKEGNGKQAYPNANVKINYTGYLADGKMFESTILNETPIEFQIGTTIKGLNEGLLLMHQGAKYRFVIPPDLAYGDLEAGDGRIPANATLVFDCELIEVK